MKRESDSYARALFDMGIEKKRIEESWNLYKETPELKKALSNPSVTKEEKHKVIDLLFPEPMRNFLKVLCDNGKIDLFKKIYESYEKMDMDSKNVLTAEMIYVTEPSTEQIADIKRKLVLKYNKDSVKLEMKQDASLVGGFILRVDDQEYDYSVNGRLARLYKKLAWR